jgi:hypothetical protein
MSDTREREQLARILAVRVTKRAAVRLQLARLAAEARETELAAQAAAAEAERVAAAGLIRIQNGRAEILSGPFQVNAMAELRQTVDTVNVECASAQAVVADAAALADRIELERQTVAHNLLSADRRCERLEEKLKELKAHVLNKRDERDIEDFASTQVAHFYARPPASAPGSGAPGSGADDFVAAGIASPGLRKTEVSDPECQTSHRPRPAVRPDPVTDPKPA